MMAAIVSLDFTLPVTSRNNHCEFYWDFPTMQLLMMAQANNRFESETAFNKALKPVRIVLAVVLELPIERKRLVVKLAIQNRICVVAT